MGLLICVMSALSLASLVSICSGDSLVVYLLDCLIGVLFPLYNALLFESLKLSHIVFELLLGCQLSGAQLLQYSLQTC